MGDFAKDVDFRGNKLKRAKVEILDRNAIDDDAAIDKQFVDDSLKYDTTLSENVAIEPTNEILDRTKLHDKSTEEIFDELFYPLILASYELPTHTATVRFVDVGTDDDVLLLEPGAVCDVKIELAVFINSSAGLSVNKFGLTGSGIGGTVTGIDPGVHVLSNYVIQESNVWSVDLHYLGSSIQNDSRGMPDNVGATGFEYFVDGTTQITVEYAVGWPWYTATIAGAVPTPDAITLNSVLTAANGKNQFPLPSIATLELPASDEQTIFFAIPIDDISVPPMDATKDASLSVTASFTGVVIESVLDASASGQLKNYAIWSAPIGVGFSVATEYNFKA